MRTAETELFRDKIEVSLDGRQIFYLFFGGAVIASLVFVLGVMVGKRLEARSHVDRYAQTSAALDPLAALDQLGADARPTRLAFPEQLGSQDARSRDGTARPPARSPARIQSAKPSSRTNPMQRLVAVEHKQGRSAAAPVVRKATSRSSAAVAPPVPAAPTAAKAKAKVKAKPKPAPRKLARAKFTLQLSSFQDRAEAEAFHARLRAAGYRPYITEANVPGKGIWFRVRLGRYVTHTDALAAKARFEKQQRIIAYVTRLRR